MPANDSETRNMAEFVKSTLLSRRKYMLKKFENINYDRIILVIAECYLILPIIIFMFGWLKFVYAFLGCVIFVGFATKLYKSFSITSESNINIISKNNVSFWLSVIIISGIWVYMSGIGSYVYQNSDYWVRNPIFNDLSTYSWPVFYDLSKESDIVKSICGSDTVAFSYYFSWWLPVCLAVKLFSLSHGMGNLLLYMWAFLGILLITYLICRKLRCCSWVIPIVLIIFSGLDAVPVLMNHILKNNWGRLSEN